MQKTLATFLRAAGLPVLGVAALCLASCVSVQETVIAQMGQEGEAQARVVPEKTFSVLWWHKVEGTLQRPFRPIELAAPEFDPVDRRVFVATRDGFLTAFSEAGARLWEVDLGGPFNAGPLLVNDPRSSLPQNKETAEAASDSTLYVASGSGTLWALDPATGEKRWSYTTTDAFMTQPVVADDLVLAMTAADTLIALDRATGTWRWQYRRDLPSGLTLFGAARPAVSGQRVFAGFADGFAVALDLEDGGVLWARELSRAKAFRDIDGAPVLDAQGNVYFTSNSDGLFCLEAATGNLRWNQQRPGLTSLALNEVGNKIYAGGQGFVGLFDTKDGRMRWGRELPDAAVVTGLTSTNGQLLAVNGAHPMLVIEEESGRVRRVFEPGHGVTAPVRPGSSGEVFVLSNRGYIYGLALHP
ncbi:MAG: PQQ-like beta-propeller repeat protein [Myxococcales bacterium]|jgi:outer membrane protein assembly factor BamB|nr:PQQ-like beta-propeller repeat protein [Myxococcales bacterium]